MKDKTYLSSIGIIIFFILTVIDKFILELPDLLYIIIGTISIILIIIGFLSDKKKQSNKRNIKTIFLTFLVTFLLILIYINPLYIYRNNQVIKHIENIQNKEQIEIKELIPFDFDKIYIAYPYTSKDQIEKDLNIKSRYIKDNNINDDYQEIIIIKDNKVISSFLVSLNNDNFSIQSMSSNNIIENDNQNIFQIYKENNRYYFNEISKRQEKSYKSLTFTIPGTWYEEDNEDDYKLYYLDDLDNNDYMTLKELSKYNDKDYKKILEKENLTVITEENLTNQTLEIFYYKIKKDETHIEQRIIIKSDTIYEFSISSAKSRTSKYYEELLTIIDSIK